MQGQEMVITAKLQRAQMRRVPRVPRLPELIVGTFQRPVSSSPLGSTENTQPVCV